MNRNHARVLGVLVASLLLVPAVVRADDDHDTERRISPRAWMSMLELGVLRVPLEGDAYETRFDYEGFLARPEAERMRRDLREAFLEVDPDALTDEQRLVWAVNAYNFLVIDRVLEAYDDGIASIADIGGKDSFSVFDEQRYRIGGERYSLNSLESHFVFLDPVRDKNQVNPRIDPRYHFVLVCAAKGCPPLLPVPFSWGDDMLDYAVRNALRSPRHFWWEEGRAHVGQIFTWYEADFGWTEGGIRGFLRRYAPIPDNVEDFEIVADIPWDWSLNEPE